MLYHSEEISSGHFGGVSGGTMRMSIAHWNINLYTPEAERIFNQINTDGVAVIRAQPGFVRYRLMRADSTTTIAVAEWQSEELGKVGAEHYREWMRTFHWTSASNETMVSGATVLLLSQQPAV
jgi:hypothetical protein